MHIRSVSARTLLLLLSTSLLVAETMDLNWKDLAPVVTGKRVWIPLNDGIQISGTVQAVEPEGLKIDIGHTSNRKAWPKGPATLPRSAVSTMRLGKTPGHKGIIIGGAVGAGVGITAGGILTAIRHNEGGTQGGDITAAAFAAPIAVGLLVGWLFDSAGHGHGQEIVIRGD